MTPGSRPWKRRSFRSTPPRGVVVSGSFTGRDDDNTYVWLRRFDSQEQKETFAKTIAESDYWKNEVVPDIQAMLDREAMVVTALEATGLSVIN